MSATITRHRKRKKLKADINVVPYIDVMLVLLIIFMVTAPLLSLGVDVELPQAKAKPIEQQKDPVIVSVTADGAYTLKLEGGDNEPIDATTLQAKVSAFVRANPEVPVFVAGSRDADYATVFDTMVLLQQAGVPRVGLMGQPPEK
ncbi:protein TolR [Arenimonas terrae]|jgi:biopolymer transport protein TolR|uniref:Tol-Pal system protein TolR n=1 Tax=Arenimonas terrae TaxID=2546226 RepID=A0A5C4RW24_9GAMM|nr:protein TolR [Arenimonas terrae]TNJ35456.1 protein TolR [Arenimonas terrae]